ncbi:MAG: hypothetical protein KF897_12220 [Opitutaceae bacterium]|nr:hypothetical protein [Opitutaceae bacterium]
MTADCKPTRQAPGASCAGGLSLCRPALRPSQALLAGAVLASALILTGCRSPAPALQAGEAKLAETFSADWQRALPETAIAWPDAVARLEAQNLDLRRSRDAVTAARERVVQVSRDLLPGAALTANAMQAVTRLGDFSGEDAALSFYAFVNVPGLVQWRVRRYGAELELIRAEWAHELKRRELIIQLRELFLRDALLAQRRRNLDLAARWPAIGSLAQRLETNPPGLEREAVLWALRREADSLQTASASLLGDATRLWRLDASSVPDLGYDREPPALTEPAAYGRLLRRLQAADLEAARLRVRGVKLQYWPDLSLNLSGPPLLQVSGGRRSEFSADQVFVTLTGAVNLDLRGTIAQQLREAKRDFALLEARLREQNAQTIQRLQQALAALVRNGRELQLTEARLGTLRGLPATTTPARARDNLERLLALDQQRTSLLLERAQLEALFWLLDEARWDNGRAGAPPSLLAQTSRP